MSRLNDLDREQDIRTGLEMYQAYCDIRSHLFDTERIPKDELKFLVLASYQAEAITEGKACELLNCDRLQFRELFL